jgi:hypothetical protein
MYRYRWRVSGTICWDRLLLNSFKLPHAYFYGNWRAKILNICRDEGIHLTVTRGGGQVSTCNKGRIGYSCDERVAVTRGGLLRARCCPTRISCRVARPFQRASRTDQIVPGTTARKNAKPVCSERGIQLLAERISNIRPKAGCWDDPGLRPFAFRSGSRASVFSWRIPVIISTRFTTTIRGKWRWRAKDHTHSAPRNLLEDLGSSRDASWCLYSIWERSASRVSLPESSSSVSPAWSKHRRQSPQLTRNALSQCGHSFGWCVIVACESVRPQRFM